MPRSTARGRGRGFARCHRVPAATIGWARHGTVLHAGANRCTPINAPSETPMHVVTDPAILYFGTPVVLISTLNEDGSANLAPMSSAWWLRGRCMLGLDPTSKTS